MSSIDVLGTRQKLTERELCPNSNPEVAATFLDEMLDEALDGYVTDATLQRTVDQLLEQWRTERAAVVAQQAQFLAEIRREISEFREENNVRERERDERERERDERERQRARDQEARDAKLRNWVLGVVGLGFTAVSLVTGLIVAFG